MKRVLLLFRQKGTAKPELVCSYTIDPRPGSLLGARDVVSMAYADFEDSDELRLIREEEAVRRGWIGKKTAASYAFKPERLPERETSSRGVNPFDD